MVLKGRSRLPKELVMIPLSTESIEWPPTGPPSEAYSLGAQPTSLKTKTSSLCPSLLKSATNQPTGTQGGREKNSARIGVTSLLVGRLSSNGESRLHHYVSYDHFTTLPDFLLGNGL